MSTKPSDALPINSRKKLTGSLSNLANYTQIFIDDINGEDYFDTEKK